MDIGVSIDNVMDRRISSPKTSLSAHQSLSFTSTSRLTRRPRYDRRIKDKGVRVFQRSFYDARFRGQEAILESGR